MKVAITGASGFIGTHVLTELLNHKLKIIAVTRDSTRLNNLNKSIQIVEMDIARPTLECFEKMGCPDVLIHLAWDGLPNYKSLHHFEAELPRQYQFLKTLVEAGLKSLVVTGTCFEYGMQSGALSTATQARPTNPYGYAKDALRQQLQYLKSTRNFNFTWARLFYMYGKGQPDTSLYPKLKDAVLRGDKKFNMSGGEQLRDYLRVEEVASLLVQLAISQGSDSLVNICSGKPISVRKLTEQWIHENNWNIDLNLGYYPYPNYEPLAFWGDLSCSSDRVK